MATQLNNQYTFDAQLVAKAIAVRDGAFIAIDDLAFTVNNLGRKIAQTQVIEIEGRQVSVAFVQDDGTTYDLVLPSDHPVVLGTYAELQAKYTGAYDRMVQAFGGVGRFTPEQMVIALYDLTERKVPLTSESLGEVATRARMKAMRGAWVVKNRFDSMALSPVDWAKTANYGAEVGV